MLLVQQLLQSFVNYLIQLLHLIDEYVIIDCGDNATTAMLCEVTEEIKNITEHDSELTDEKLGTTPEKGRVWRWRNSNSNSRKNTEGPVLRATVKPVKRFIPEVNSTASAPANPPSQSATIHKQVVSINNDENATTEVKTKKQTSSNTSHVTQPSSKKKRVREQWSIEDKTHFFEAVAVHGKDFEAIQKAIAQKHKKRGDESVIKTKDQVRHLYYRTWTTISKLLDHEASASHNIKGSQELLAVINYGELRKKLGGCILKKKGIMKLNELITYGSTSVRVKGKNYRIKTPSCKALKRMHDLEGAAKKSNVFETRRIKLPLRVNLELHPLSISSWNHVHLLAHNPRIRFNVPLDCQLSCILSFLHKKWQSLSSKMFQVAQGNSISSVFNFNAHNFQNHSSTTVEIHVPPEATIKAKFQVHEIMTTKTHSIVSYVMHKTGKQLTSSKKKKKRFQEVEASDCIPVASGELCNSSEDESAFVDHLSDAEENPGSARSLTPIDDLKEEDAKALNDVDSDEGAVESTFLPSNNFIDKEILSDIDHVKVVDSFFQETEIFAEHIEDNVADQTDSNESNPIENSDLPFETNEEKKKEDNTIQPGKEKNADVSCSYCPDVTKTIALTDCYVPLESAAIHGSSLENGEAMHLPRDLPPEPSTPVDAPDPDPPLEAESNSPTKPSSLNLAIQKSWSKKNVGDVSIAEIYLMLGKPTTFKLCYHLKSGNENDCTSLEPSKACNEKISTGVAALVQYASLMLSKLKKTSIETSKSNQTAIEADKRSEEKHSSKTSIGIQCSICEEDSTQLHRKSVPNFSNAVSKKAQQSKNFKKSTSLSNLKSQESFVIPNMPPRKKRNQSTIASKSALSNIQGLPQGGQVRLSDVEFRKQMDALNRRIDLFRSHNRTRSMRKPFIVQRTMMPNAKSVRKMMTLSVDSMGASRVGFLPISNQTLGGNGEPQLEAVGATISNVSNTNMRNSTSANPPTTTADLEQSGVENSSTMKEPNVVALAAEEAGLISGVPAVSSTAISENISAVDGGPEKINVVDDENLPAEPLQAFDNKSNERPSSPEACQDSLIGDDVILPVRPPTPSGDSISDMFNFVSNSRDAYATSTANENNCPDGDAPVLTMPALDLPLTPQKRIASPIHPWSINCNSRDGLSGFSPLNTPQRILPSDTEDSMDSVIYNIIKRPRAAGDVVNELNFEDAETDLQMQCLMSENSVDFMAKFHDLMHSTATGEMLASHQENEEEKKGDG